MKANLYTTILLAGAMITAASAYAQPTTSAPTPPELAKSKVISIYSDSYASTGFEFGDWGSGTAYAPEKIGDTDNVAKFTTTALGYFGWGFKNVNTAAMDKLHVDIYADAAFSVRVVPITGGKEVGQTIDVSAGKWTSVDLETKTFANGGANLANVYQIKFDNVPSQTFYVDNVYFWSTSTDVDTEAPAGLTATLVESAFTSVTLSCKATDNSGAVEFVVADEAKGYNKTAGGVSGEATTVVLDGLTAGTDYNFTVKARDAEGNECADVATIVASTAALPEPANKASLPDSKVISIFCDEYTPACPFGIGGWDSRQKCLICSLQPTTRRYILKTSTTSVLSSTTTFRRLTPATCSTSTSTFIRLRSPNFRSLQSGAQRNSLTAANSQQESGTPSFCR